MNGNAKWSISRIGKIEREQILIEYRELRILFSIF